MATQVTILDNGLRVATDSMDTVESVSIGVWVDVGTRYEAPEMNGVSHLLEHMAFKGTKRRTALDIAEQIEDVGGHINAYTSRENTAYYARVLKEDQGLALDIIADILQHSTMDGEEFERERAVILQEINSAEDTPDDVIFDHFQQAAYPDRIRYFATLPWQYPDRAVAELARACDDKGAVGVFVDRLFHLDSPELEAGASRRGVRCSDRRGDQRWNTI